MYIGRGSRDSEGRGIAVRAGMGLDDRRCRPLLWCVWMGGWLAGCVCVWVWVSVCVFLCVCLCVCVCVYVNVCVRTHTHTHTHTHIQTHTHTHLYMHTFAHTCMHIRTCVYRNLGGRAASSDRVPPLERSLYYHVSLTGGHIGLGFRV
jgi:hypothetical protein